MPITVTPAYEEPTDLLLPVGKTLLEAAGRVADNYSRYRCCCKDDYLFFSGKGILIIHFDEQRDYLLLHGAFLLQDD